MNRNNFWRFILVVLVILWSLYELYPPEGRDLLLFFREKATGRDAAFSAMFQKAQALQKAMPEKPYDNLAEAIGTNDITHYFPSFGAKDQLHPTTYILNRLAAPSRRPHPPGSRPARRHLIPREHGHQPVGQDY